MLSAISGLRAHQTMMDVVGHNISNVNTPGFKASRVTFEEALSEVIGGSSQAGDAAGGVNPIQLGLGSRVAAIDGVFSQGASQLTGRPTDLAVQGEGFFVLDRGGERIFTRSGAFNFDDNGTLVASGGARVMGWAADNGVIDLGAPLSPIELPLSQVIGARATTSVQFGGNLSASLSVGESHATTFYIFDSIGNQHEVVARFTNEAAGSWTLSVTVDGTDMTVSDPALTFDTNGNLTSTGSIRITGLTPDGAEPLDLDLVLDGAAGIAQYAGESSAEALSNDGKAIGYLRGFAIGEDGTLTAHFSNGDTKAMAKVATATFENPSGLIRVGDSAFIASLSSGDANIGAPGTGDRGLMQSGTLELSNVDLALEFTSLIIAQRGFQANGRVITASDEVLADLVNLKR
jgi:flagellar hook protein FlgE